MYIGGIEVYWGALFQWPSHPSQRSGFRYFESSWSLSN